MVFDTTSYEYYIVEGGHYRCSSKLMARLMIYPLTALGNPETRFQSFDRRLTISHIISRKSTKSQSRNYDI